MSGEGEHFVITAGITAGPDFSAVNVRDIGADTPCFLYAMAIRG